MSQLSGKKNAKIFEFDFQCCIPDPNMLKNFVIQPQLPELTRLHCTMIRHSEKTTEKATGGANGDLNNSTNKDQESKDTEGGKGTTSAYTLYLEHLGGFLPLLKGKRVSKIRPEFIIYDPQLPEDR